MNDTDKSTLLNLLNQWESELDRSKLYYEEQNDPILKFFENEMIQYFHWWNTRFDLINKYNVNPKLLIYSKARSKRCKICKKPDLGGAFHHLDKKTKVCNVSAMVGAKIYTEEDLINEISKCIFVCKSCHARIHNQERKDREIEREKANEEFMKGW